MSKKKIIIGAALAVVSFGLAMGGAFLLPSHNPAVASAAQVAAGPDANEVRPVKLSLQKQDLDDLIHSLHRRIADCRSRTQQLDEREKQMHIVQDQLASQAKELEDLRVKAAAALEALRQAKADMDNERVKIAAEDKANLKKTAAIYEKMDPDAGGKILADMCRQNNEDAVVRILYYMDERSAAKMIEALGDQDLAARLVEKIKLVREQTQPQRQ